MNPSSSIGIERVLIELSIRSSHFCLELYYLTQTYLIDLINKPRTAEFKLCLRLFNQLQELILFNKDMKLLGEEGDEDFGLKAIKNMYIMEQSILKKKGDSSKKISKKLLGLIKNNFVARLQPKIKENAFAAIIGMSGIAASVGGSLQTPAIQLLSIRQGYQKKMVHIELSQEKSQSPLSTVKNNINDSSNASSIKTSFEKDGSFEFGLNTPESDASKITHLERNTSYRKQKSILCDISKSKMLSQNQIEEFEKVENNLNSETNLLKTHRKRQLEYFESQLEFVTEIIEISKRLCLIAKEDRMANLKVELNMINHHLLNNRKTCIPMLCDYHDAKNSENHDWIVRVPVDEAVVLNSAERAPYLLIVEVLRHDNLDDVSKNTKIAENKNFKKNSDLHQQPLRNSENKPGELGETSDKSINDLGSEIYTKSKSINNDPVNPYNGKNGLKEGTIDTIGSDKVNVIDNKNQNINVGIVQSSSAISSEKNSEIPEVTLEEIEERMKTAFVLLSQLNKHQKYQRSQKQVKRQPLPQQQSKTRGRNSLTSQLTNNLYKLASISAPSKFNRPEQGTLENNGNNKETVEDGIFGKSNIFQFFENMAEKNTVRHIEPFEISRTSGVNRTSGSGTSHQSKDMKVGMDPNNQIRANLVEELMTLHRMRSKLCSSDGFEVLEQDVDVEKIETSKDDQSALVLGEDWEGKKQRFGWIFVGMLYLAVEGQT
ncbi:hypothetical protein BB558_005830 [Smittium angustum]|uniref:Uncharacterized protein n=1 Tax=Smittium angustum TaxID=133377 RepID=A0A2U1IZG0_SMIAN|nr:hypothetical protein BB558_005830 [Smittium angustum]